MNNIILVLFVFPLTFSLYAMELSDRPQKKRKAEGLEVISNQGSFIFQPDENEISFIGKVPKRFKAALHAIKDDTSEDTTALEISGPAKSGKSLLVKLLARNLDTKRLFMFDSLSFLNLIRAHIKSSPTPLEFGDACDVLLERYMEEFKAHSVEKYGIFCLTRFEKILGKLTELEQVELAKSIREMLEAERLTEGNFAKKIIFITTSAKPSLRAFYQQRSLSDRTLIQSIQLDHPKKKNRIKLWDFYLGKISEKIELENVNTEELAGETEGFTGYDIDQIARCAAYNIAYKHHKNNTPNAQECLKKEIKIYAKEVYPQLYKQRYGDIPSGIL